MWISRLLLCLIVLSAGCTTDPNQLSLVSFEPSNTDYIQENSEDTKSLDESGLAGLHFIRSSSSQNWWEKHAYSVFVLGDSPSVVRTPSETYLLVPETSGLALTLDAVREFGEFDSLESLAAEISRMPADWAITAGGYHEFDPWPGTIRPLSIVEAEYVNQLLEDMPR